MNKIIKNLRLAPMIIIIGIALSSCKSFTQDIKVDLPAFKKQVVIEAYLEPNKAAQVAITGTQDYFGIIGLPFINKAKVKLSDGTRTFDLIQSNKIDLSNPKNPKLFNYTTKDGDTFSMREGVKYTISVDTGAAPLVTAETYWLRKVQWDTIKTNRYNGRDDKMNIVFSFYDNLSTQDYYRIMIKNISDSNRIVRDYISDDHNSDHGKLVSGTAFDFKAGDTLDLTLYHITKEYYDYLLTSSRARQGVGNPFSEPSAILSNVKNGSGIFTTLPYERKRVVLK